MTHISRRRGWGATWNDRWAGVTGDTGTREYGMGMVCRYRGEGGRARGGRRKARKYEDEGTGCGEGSRGGRDRAGGECEQMSGTRERVIGERGTGGDEGGEDGRELEGVEEKAIQDGGCKEETKGETMVKRPGGV